MVSECLGRSGATGRGRSFLATYFGRYGLAVVFYVWSAASCFLPPPLPRMQDMLAWEFQPASNLLKPSSPRIDMLDIVIKFLHAQGTLTLARINLSLAARAPFCGISASGNCSRGSLVVSNRGECGSLQMAWKHTAIWHSGLAVCVVMTIWDCRGMVVPAVEASTVSGICVQMLSCCPKLKPGLSAHP